MTRHLYWGATEYIEADVTSDVEISTQTVHFSFDGGTNWVAAEFTDIEPATTRTARLLVDVNDTFPRRGPYKVLVRVTDSPESPVIDAGSVHVK